MWLAGVLHSFPLLRAGSHGGARRGLLAALTGGTDLAPSGPQQVDGASGGGAEGSSGGCSRPGSPALVDGSSRRLVLAQGGRAAGGLQPKNDL